MLGGKGLKHFAQEQVVLLEQKLRKKSKFKFLKLNYKIEMLDWDDKKQQRNLKTSYEMRCTLHNVQVDLNKEFEQLVESENKTFNVLERCTCLVSAREVFA